MNTVLHIGTYKTGSTALQLWLRDHPDLLAEHGYRFPRGWLRRDNHLELALALMHPDRLSPARMRGTEWEDARWRAELIGQVDADLVAHQDVNTILSAEDTMLLRAPDELVNLRAHIGDARIVVYLRDRDDFLAAWEDTLTGKLDLPLSDEPDAFNCVQADSCLTDYKGLLMRWAQHFTRVTVINYDRVCATDGSVIPEFLDVLGIMAPPDAYTTRANERGGAYSHREPGLRWTHGLPFGADPVTAPTRA